MLYAIVLPNDVTDNSDNTFDVIICDCVICDNKLLIMRGFAKFVSNNPKLLFILGNLLFDPINFFQILAQKNHYYS